MLANETELKFTEV